MAGNDTLYFDKVKLLDGSYAEVRDTAAREAIQGGTHFRGVTTTALTDGASTNPITIAGDSYTAVNGDIVVYGNKEFIFAEVDSKWHELGDTTGLGALALKDSVSAVYTPAGTVSKPNVTVTPTGATIKEFSAEGSVTSGTIKEMSADGSVTNTTIKEFSADGSVTSGTIKEMSTAGSVVAGSANVPTEVTLPTLTTTLNGTTLELSWSAGSVVAGTAGTPTSVTLPTFKDASVVTAATMPTYKETSVVGAATMPTFKDATVVTAATMPTVKETSVLTAVAAELAAAPEFSGTQSTIVSQ